MNVFEHLRANTFPFGFEVGDLTSNHAVDGAGGRGDFGSHFYATFGIDGSGGDRFECEREERVARENGGGLAELLMAGRLAATEVVVIERGQIVVNQRISVDEFDGASWIHACGNVGRKNASGFETENRADAFASGEDAITHRFVDGGRRGRLWRQKFLQRGVYCQEILIEEGRKFHRVVKREGNSGKRVTIRRLPGRTARQRVCHRLF